MWQTLSVLDATRLLTSALECLKSGASLMMEESNVSSTHGKATPVGVTVRTTPPPNTYMGLGRFREGDIEFWGLVITGGWVRLFIGFSLIPVTPCTVEVISSYTETAKRPRAPRRVAASSSTDTPEKQSTSSELPL